MYVIFSNQCVKLYLRNGSTFVYILLKTESCPQIQCGFKATFCFVYPACKGCKGLQCLQQGFWDDITGAKTDKVVIQNAYELSL
jgi:hypothetical protein